MRSSESVVPIGGAPFVRPYSHIRPIDTRVATSSSSSSSVSSSVTSGPSPTSLEASPRLHASSGDLSVAMAGIAGCSTSSSIGGTPTSPHLEAALRYSSALHEHTRRMWERERSSIERAKHESGCLVEGDGAANAVSPSAHAVPSAGPGRRSSLNGNSTWGVDALWSRKKKHTKNSHSIF